MLKYHKLSTQFLCGQWKTAVPFSWVACLTFGACRMVPIARGRANTRLISDRHWLTELMHGPLFSEQAAGLQDKVTVCLLRFLPCSGCAGCLLCLATQPCWWILFSPCRCILMDAQTRLPWLYCPKLFQVTRVGEAISFLNWLIFFLLSPCRKGSTNLPASPRPEETRPAAYQLWTLWCSMAFSSADLFLRSGLQGAN